MNEGFRGGSDITALADWSATPLGLREMWPQQLKTLVQLLLESTQPMFLCWGPGRTLIYNEGYARILDKKHPQALGRDLLEVWSDIRGDLEPIVAEAYAGNPVQMRDVAFYNIASGRAEESYFSFSYTPIRGETGEVKGFFCPCEETTEQVLERGRMTLRTELSERLREAIEPEALKAEVLALLGNYLQADHVGFAVPDPENRCCLVETARGAEGATTMTAGSRLQFGPSVFSVLAEGGVCAIADTAHHPMTIVQMSGEPGAGAMMLIPLFRKGELSQVLFVLSDVPRAWLHADTELVRQKTERTWDVLERLRADRALRDENAFLDLVIEMAPVGILIARDPLGLPPIMNREGRRLTGNEQFGDDAEGYRYLGAIHPDGRPYGVREYPANRVLRTGETVENEPMIYRLDDSRRRWLVNARPVRDLEGRIIAAVTIFNDVEDRLRAEEEVHLINRELNHRVKNLFAIIRSLTLLSGRDETDVADFTKKLLGRIDALAASHVLSINAPGGNDADLAEIIRTVISPFAEGSEVDGPAVAIPDGSITPLSLILHELATNAAKYGAWSVEGGSLSVTWLVEGSAEKRALEFRWRESFPGRRSPAPQERTGFGSKLINSSAQQLGAKISPALSDDGFLFTMHWPLPAKDDRSDRLASPDQLSWPNHSGLEKPKR